MTALKKEIHKLSWGVDGFGNRHYICDITGECFGIMTNGERFDFEDRFCRWCETGKDMNPGDRVAACLAKTKRKISKLLTTSP